MASTFALVTDGDTCTNCDGATWIRDWDCTSPDGESELAPCPDCNPTIWLTPEWPMEFATDTAKAAGAR